MKLKSFTRLPLPLLLLLPLLVGATLATSAPTLERYALGGGGGRATSGIYTLNGTIGQAVVGPASQSTYNLCAGFWCGLRAEYGAYLPLVLRSY